MMPAERPKRQLGQYTTTELATYRRQLEHSVRFYERKHPAAPVLADLRGWLAEVAAEEDSRRRLRERISSHG